MKRSKTKIDVHTQPETVRIDEFAIVCKRDRTQITRAISNGKLNWGTMYGLTVVVIDDLSNSFKERCRALDKLKHLMNK